MATDEQRIIRVSTFVPDLTFLILDCTTHWWPRDYANLALLSSDWLAPVRKRLYRAISLRTVRSCNRLKRSLEGNPELIGNIRSLDIQPIYPDEQGENMLGASIGAIRYLLDLRSVTSLTIGGELVAGAASLFLQCVAPGNSVKDLRVDGSLLPRCAVEDPPFLLWDAPLAYRFPRLQSLTLVEMAFEVSLDKYSSPLSLSSLTLIDVEFMDGDLQHLSRWDNLRHLSISAIAAADIVDDDDVLSILDLCKNSLEVLRLHIPCGISAPAGPEDGVFSRLTELPCLRELDYEGYEITPTVLEDITRVCKHLETLTTDTSISSDCWTRFSRAVAPASLRTIVFSSSKCSLYGWKGTFEGTSGFKNLERNGVRSVFLD